MYYNARQYGRGHKENKQKWLLWGIFLIVIIGVSVGIFFTLKVLLSNENGYFREVTYIPEESVGYVRFKNVDQWNRFQRTLALNEGESVRSATGRNLHLDFFNGTRLYLDMGAEVTIQKSAEVENKELFAIIDLHNGSIWAEIKPQNGEDAIFRFVLSNTLYVESKGGTIVVSPSSIRVLGEGNSSAEVIAMDNSGKISFTKRVSIGQEVSISPDALREALERRYFSLTSISPDFYTDEFYVARIPEDLLITPSPSPSLAIKEDTEGEFPTPEITSPGKTGDSVEVNKDSLYITGKAPEGTQKIYVNDYLLSKFTPGDTTWRYLASTALESLSQGENLFKIVAEGEDGKKSKVATITLIYTPSNTHSTVKGTLKITSPNSGQDITINTNEITLSGTAPSNAAFIQVNDYFLQKFKAGNTSWSYIDKELLEGQNVFTVQALDAQKRFLASDKITITVKKEDEEVVLYSTPIVQTPSASIKPTIKPTTTATTSELTR